jgi:thiol-disulfide isomerase/thioredoxin
MSSLLRCPYVGLAALLLLAMVLFPSLPTVSTTTEKSNGFGGDIDWHSWEDMKTFDYSSNTKPIMWLFSKPWCGACKRLKADFGEGAMGQKIEELSESFVMVSA